jgi:predicted Zn-dependent protease
MIKHYEIRVLVALITIMVLPQCTPPPKEESPPRTVYYFADGLQVTRLWEESCQNGKLDQVLHKLAIQLEQRLQKAALEVSPQELQALGDRQFNAFMVNRRQIGGRDRRRLRRIVSKLKRFQIRKDIVYRTYLVEHLKRPNLVNAWVTATGDIFVTKGMLAFVQSEDELAYIIAHEIAHVENMHPDRKIAMRKIMQSTFGPGGLVERLTGATESLIVSLNQYNEIVADRAALYLMNEAGYDPEAALHFLSRLDDYMQENNSMLVFESLMKSHPYNHVRFSCLSRYIYESKRVEQPNAAPQPAHWNASFYSLTTRNFASRLLRGVNSDP